MKNKTKINIVEEMSTADMSVFDTSISKKNQIMDYDPYKNAVNVIKNSKTKIQMLPEKHIIKEQFKNIKNLS